MRVVTVQPAELLRHPENKKKSKITNQPVQHDFALYRLVFPVFRQPAGTEGRKIKKIYGFFHIFVWNPAEE